MEVPKSTESLENTTKNECEVNKLSRVNAEPPHLRLDIKEVDKLFSIISQSTVFSEIVNSELKVCKANSRFTPYPVHRQLFIQQHHEQERRRQSMVASTSKVPSVSIESYQNNCKNLDDMNMLRTKVVKKVISFIDRYTTRLYSHESDYNDKCAVCMCNYQENEQLRKLQCKHLFHRKCVDEWLVKSYLCPICRTELVGKNGGNLSCNIGRNHTNEINENAELLTSNNV